MARYPIFYVDPESRELLADRRCDRSNMIRRAHRQLVWKLCAVIAVLCFALAGLGIRHRELDADRVAQHDSAITTCGEQIRMLTPETYQGHCEIYSIWMERMDAQHCHRTVSKF